jgi:hypothetical protein
MERDEAQALSLNIKADGIGLSRKLGDQTDTLLQLPDPELISLAP